MIDDSSILLGLAALFFVPLALGWLIRRWQARNAAAFVTAAALGLAALWWFGPAQALLAAVWGLGFGWLGASDEFMRPPSLEELARDAKNGRRRWWEFFGGG